MLKPDYSLYLVSNRDVLMQGETLESAVEKAILGGVSFVQLREKNISFLEFYNLATKIKKITDYYKVPFVINDRIDVALAVDADGVHVGQDDMPLNIARQLLGENKIIGVSAHNVEEAQKAEENGANYLGVGAIWRSNHTKKDAEIVGIETLKEICKNVSIPVVAIGGINKDNIKDLKNTGISGVSMVSAILHNEDITVATKDLMKEVKNL